MQPITVANNGPDIVETNYWDHEMARKGLFYLTINAGALRLLVPDLALVNLHEMKTGRFVTLEPSQVQPGAVDVVFEDMTDAPFFVALDKRAQIDRCGALAPRDNLSLSVWTRHGKQMSFSCGIKRGCC